MPPPLPKKKGKKTAELSFPTWKRARKSALNKPADLGPVCLRCQSRGRVIRQQSRGQRCHPEGLLSTQTPTGNKNGSPQRGSEIYSSHLLLLQTVAAERVPREPRVHKSSRVLESIKGEVRSGS